MKRAVNVSLTSLLPKAILVGMNRLAMELNDTLRGTVVADLLSDFGKRFYYPMGIPAQDAEAKKYAKTYNATVGMAFANHEPIELSPVRAAMPGLTPFQSVAYAPTAGDPELRKRWKEQIYRKNPDLAGVSISEPVVVPGLTNGISQAADLFVDPGDPVVIPDMFWENYSLVFEDRREAPLISFPFFAEEAKASGGGAPRWGLNLQGFRETLRSHARKGKVVLVVNFPNNPTGYSPTNAEADALASLVGELAAEGLKILVLVDDAYFGLFYEPDVYRQSLFARLARLHENVLAVKIDGATKEDFVWGFRLGFVTFGGKGLTEAHYEALNKKLMGAIRSSISNSSRPAQSLLLTALASPGYEAEKKRYFESLKARYLAVREIVSKRTSGRGLTTLPFNSGYFMSFRFEGGSADALRRHLLLEKGIGTVSLEDRYLRVAYSSMELDELVPLYDAIFKAADQLAR